LQGAAHWRINRMFPEPLPVCSYGYFSKVELTID